MGSVSVARHSAENNSCVSQSSPPVWEQILRAALVKAHFVIPFTNEEHGVPA